MDNNKNNKNENSNQKTIEAYIRIRPGVEAFLCQISKYYDIYVYSASSKNYLNTIIKNIDKNNLIKQCFCRDDCIMYVEDCEEDFDKPNNKYRYIKDLKKINKELRNIVFIDNNTISFKLQEKNGIPIKSWFDDYEDLELYKLIPILKNLSGFYDVRVEISKFVQNKTFIWSKSIDWLIENCLNSSYLNEINTILSKEQKKHEFQIGNFNNINMNINKPKVVNNINNILINLYEDDNIFKNNTKYIKKHSFSKKINTEHNKNLNSNNSKIIKIHKKDLDKNNTDTKIFIENTLKKNNTKKIENIKIYSNSNYSKKIQSKLFKTKIADQKQLMNPLLHQYSLCFAKNHFMDKMGSGQSKPNAKKKKDNDNNIINKYFLQNQNRVIFNFINNKK
jgi:Dullard-like phosphatase family protein